MKFSESINLQVLQSVSHKKKKPDSNFQIQNLYYSRVLNYFLYRITTLTIPLDEDLTLSQL